jgi:hypothetical protein
MALKNKRKSRVWSRLHFLVRLLGLTGLLAAGVGALFATADHLEWRALLDTLMTPGDLDLPRLTAWLIAGGGALVVLALLVELIVVLGFTAGRRSAFGLNVGLQVVLATAVLVGINVWSFQHHDRFDCTRSRQFTLPTEIQDQLRQLKGETTIVVYQQHKSSGLFGDKPDGYDFAAERKVVEKVKDLVEQLRMFGARFRVEVLDVGEEGFFDKLEDLTEDNKELREAIAAAPENCIFFQSGKKVQRLNFSDFLQLDKPASKDTLQLIVYRKKKPSELSDADRDLADKLDKKVADLVTRYQASGPVIEVIPLTASDEGYTAALARLNRDHEGLSAALAGATGDSLCFVDKDRARCLGAQEFLDLKASELRAYVTKRGNLVLLARGVEPFASRILNVEEKKPRIGILTIHEVLTTDSPEEIGMKGVKKTLESYGFDVRDIILKKWTGMGPEPTVSTSEEDKLERLEQDLAEVEESIKAIEQQQKKLTEMVRDWKSESLEELTKKYAKELDGNRATEAIRRLNLPRLEQTLAFMEMALKQNKEDRAEIQKEKQGLNAEGLSEQRRLADLRAKLDRNLADCDLLLIPRLTQVNLTSAPPFVIPNNLYKLDDAQLSAIRDALKAGKPLLACLGPANDRPDRRDPFAGMEPDKFEDLLAELGVRLGKQTVLYNVESKAFAERRSGLIMSGTNIEVPPVDFIEEKSAAAGGLAKAESSKEPANPIGRSLRIRSRSSGKGLDIRVRHPRPIYYDPIKEKSLAFEPEFMATTALSWNEADPFPTRERTPRYEPPKPDDPTRGTLDEKRQGPFPIGIAFETTVPATWYTGSNTKPTSVRVAVIGQGGVFTGNELSPGKQELLLESCNWLLGRDDLLSANAEEWRYPRVGLDKRGQFLWHWGTFIGLPALFAFFGCAVLMFRRLR